MIYTKSHKCSKKTTNTVQIQKQQVAVIFSSYYIIHDYHEIGS